MSESQSETDVTSSALLNADKFYESAPETESLEPTEAGESPEVSEEEETVDTEESDSGAETETEEVDSETDSTRYRFDEESGEYSFKAGGKEVAANTDKLIELASKGVGFEKNQAKTKRNEEQRQQEFTEAKAQVDNYVNDLKATLESVESLLQEESIPDDLLDDDPGEYIRREKQQRERKATLEKARAAVRENLESQVKTKADREWSQLVETMGWESNEDVKSGFDPIAEYMDSKGISRGEIYPHQVYVALSKAAKYDALEAKKETTVKEVRKAPTSVKPKKSPPKKAEKSAVEVLYGS